ncbi:MAG TPA: two-component regulator propeller domain-containing protein [Steroidobacteraceae bacterium]|nr:two-component regulator propeller domain-containing protein [Steroidobacteraceae bacterium]
MRVIAIGCLLLAWCPAVSALDPDLDVTQYAHRAWRLREGFARAHAAAMAQTPDGYLWLGTEFGLLRFDGVRTMPWQPPAGATLPGHRVRALLSARDGALWIGTLDGLASWRDGKLTQFPLFAGFGINALAEDSEGTVWVAAMQEPRIARLCSIRKTGASCEAGNELLGNWVASLHVDSLDRLWVVSAAGLWEWRPGPRQLHAIPEGALGTLQGVTEGAQQSMLVATRRNIAQIANDGQLSLLVPDAPLPTQPARLLRDRHGGIWVGTTDRGLMHIQGGRIVGFTRADGLSGDAVQRLFEDREGNIWVSTLDGLDRFSDVAVTTFSTLQGLPNALAGSVLETRDGSIWVSTRVGLYRWREGEGTAFVARSSRKGMREVVVKGLPERVASLFEDNRGRIWIGSEAGVGYLERERYTAIESIAGQLVDTIVEDRHGTLWMSLRTGGLRGVFADGRIESIPWSQLGHQDAAMRIAVDPLRGGLWLGFALGGVAHLVDGRIEMSVTPADGLGKGRVESLRVDADGTLWVGTEEGLSRLKNGRIATLSGASGLPCDGVDWMIDAGGGEIWLHTTCGIARIERSHLDAAFAAREKGVAQPKLPLTLFESSDGVSSTFAAGSYTPHVARSRDGKLWFVTQGGVSMLNPQRIPHNAIAPAVHIEQVIADRRNYALSSGSIALPALTRDLQIDYTALSLTAPEKMQFRYRLQGYDAAWRDVGTRRQAFYTDLSPGDYRFQVIAANNDGVWNEKGASVQLSIAPTFYQTRWFTALCIAGGAALLWLVLWLRGRQIEMRMRLRLEERVLERERIARDLHDTFLQSMQGLVLRFHAVLAKLPKEGAARNMMEQALNRADDVITEGRAHVYDLRQSANVTNDLPQALTAVGDEFAQTTDTKFRVIIEGAPRHLHPVVREEAYRIGAEALANAFRHAAASNIDVHIEYGRKGLTLRVLDDGRGYDVDKLHDMVTQGHFGLAGLRERAHRIRAQLEVSSRIGAGSAVELRVPASIAYANPSADRSHAV